MGERLSPSPAPGASADETLFLQPVNETAQAAPAEHHRFGQPGHSHLPARQLKLDQHVIGRERQGMAGDQLPIEHPRDRCMSTEEAGPCPALLEIERRPLVLLCVQQP